jgi:predicted MFS family arabinose efflux permease
MGTTANAVVAGIFGWPRIDSTLWLLVVLLGAMINHYSSVYVLCGLIESQMSDRNAPVKKKKLVFFLVTKIVSLVLAFALLVRYARNMVPQGLIIYIFQLIILSLSIKNIKHLIKKGPLE